MKRIIAIILLVFGWHSVASAQLCQLQLIGPQCRPCGGSGQAHVRSGGLCTACTSNCPPIVPIAPDAAAQSKVAPAGATCTPVVNEALARQALFYKLNAVTDELSRLAAVSPSAALAVNAFARHGEVIPAVDMRHGHLFAPGVPTASQAIAVITRQANEEVGFAESDKGLGLKAEYSTQVLSDERAVLTITPWVIDAEGKPLYPADAAVAVELSLLAGNAAAVDGLARQAPVYRMTGYKMID
jgi:hypothetical protein